MTLVSTPAALKAQWRLSRQQKEIARLKAEHERLRAQFPQIVERIRQRPSRGASDAFEGNDPR